MISLLERRLLFVTGKGGTGKTLVASSLAMLAASRSKRTLLCGVDAKGDLPEFFDEAQLHFKPKEVVPNLFVMLMDTQASLEEYLKLQLKLPLVAKIGPLARALDFVASAAPGVQEILTIGKLAYEVKEDHYDIVIVDAPASGHVVGQLAAADAIRDLVQVGLVRQQTTWMREILQDPVKTGAVIVTLAEEMPVAESIDLISRLRDQAQIEVAAVVANRLFEDPVSGGAQVLLEAIEASRLAGSLVERSGLDSRALNLLEGASLSHSLFERQVGHLADLEAGLPPDLPIFRLPELFLKTDGTRATRLVSEALAQVVQ